jgi:hypothetical protein
MTDELGYSVPNWGGVTTTGLVRGYYELELQKVKLWGYSVKATLEATEAVRGGLVELAAILGLGGAAALPMALKRVPKGAVSEKRYKEAGEMEPEEFKKEVDAKA